MVITCSYPDCFKPATTKIYVQVIIPNFGITSDEASTPSCLDHVQGVRTSLESRGFTISHEYPIGGLAMEREK